MSGSRSRSRSRSNQVATGLRRPAAAAAGAQCTSFYCVRLSTSTLYGELPGRNNPDHHCTTSPNPDHPPHQTHSLLPASCCTLCRPLYNCKTYNCCSTACDGHAIVKVQHDGCYTIVAEKPVGHTIEVVRLFGRYTIVAVKLVKV